jgi:hypothetical protein
MKIRGMSLVIAVLLTASACSGDYFDSSSAGEDETAKAAMADPQVTKPKFVLEPIDCETILPMDTVGVIAAARPKPGMSSEADECRTDFLSTDGSRRGQALLRFSAADTLDGPVMDTHEGNTMFEVHNVADNICDTGVALDDTLDRDEFGSWLNVRVTVETEQPDACLVAGQLLIVAFSSLLDV